MQRYVQHPTSIADVLRNLHDTEESFFHAANYLIAQATICTPVRDETTLAILQPFRDSAIDSLYPVVCAWRNFSLFTCFLSDLSSSSHLSAATIAQIARENSPLLEAAIVNVEATLAAELRRTSRRDSLFQWLTWSASMRLAPLDDLPHLISALRRYCQETMLRLNDIEHFSFCLEDLFSDNERAVAFKKHEETFKGLLNLAKFAGASRGKPSGYLFTPI
ncbi:uncharacterized protein EV420DRAFT_1639436 [Desarmillaria tabescens]|uniref:Uncharacterized protein n=1 Tax=Armillaria tabescens TaxID=1929756 RepID=A0AA39NCT5_ARMTA|nr:uncharacterized protein EV420DRAFT_1639436 [Desarmillaria tabescens]KAK0463278.1 hypothetical protein EV420DRAFT_1639436 [Desarmillaria tabescens]